MFRIFKYNFKQKILFYILLFFKVKDKIYYLSINSDSYTLVLCIDEKAILKNRIGKSVEFKTEKFVLNYLIISCIKYYSTI